MDKLGLSVHEAAHAVLATVLGVPVRYVRLCPPECEAVTAFTRPRDLAVVLHAGNIAIEHAGLNDPSLRSGRGGDDDDLRAMVRRGHVSEADVVIAKARAADLVEQHWSAISRVAMGLMDRGELSGDEIKRLVRQEPDAGEGLVVGLALGLRAGEKGFST